MTEKFIILLPPLIAIIVSLKTKKVNLSLFLGILSGVLIYSKFNILNSLILIAKIMKNKIGENFEVILFIVLLGIIVHLMNLSGATREYAKWASKKLKTKKQTLLATAFLGLMIFIDDYFNCLTVGAVMRPITDKYRISREKLAYIIDSTAAPICMLVPISSGAAIATSYLSGGIEKTGFNLFVKSIVCNYYSWFTLLFVFLIILFNVDYGKMKVFEKNTNNNNEIEIMENHFKEEADREKKLLEKKIGKGKNSMPKGKIIDLIFPIIFLIVSALICMVYTGNFFKGNVSIFSAFANCDATNALAMSGFLTLGFVAILYLTRKVITSKQFSSGLIEGFQNMVPAIIILLLAWGLGEICSSKYLNIGEIVSNIILNYNINLKAIPMISFILAMGLAFSTGTSWGTFAILLPMIVSIFGGDGNNLMILSISAVLGGSICGDHISPISDTTILSSTGASCNHINHVESQMQYALVVALISFISYIISGFTTNNFIGLMIGIVLIFSFLIINKLFVENEELKKILDKVKIDDQE